MLYFPVPIVIVLVSVGLFASLLILGVLVHLHKSGNKRAVNRILAVFIPLWVVGVAIAVLPTSPQPDPSIPAGTFNWVPFLAHRERDLGVELAANLGLFAPLGLMLAFYWRKFSVAKTTLLALGLSCLIEVTQLLLKNNRASDITDILTNTFGALIASLLGWLVYRAVSVRTVVESSPQLESLGQ